MRPEAAAALEAYLQVAGEDGLTLSGNKWSSQLFHTESHLKRKLERMTEEQANDSVAKPGYSEHQTGLAMDIEGETTKGTGLTEAFGESPEGHMGAEHAQNMASLFVIQKGKTKNNGIHL